MKKNTQKNESVFMQEVKRDIATFRRLHGRQRLAFVWDYFRWKILAAIVIIIVVVTFARLLWNGQRPYRLRVCVVLNNSEYCDDWFDSFEEKLKSDEKKGDIDVNQDQPFDYHNKYYYIQELEVQSTIASGRMDVAVCGPDMYEYLLAINACMPLNTVLPEDLTDQLKKSGQLKYDRAGLKYNPDGTINEEDAVDGYFSVDISDTAFGKKYNGGQELDEGEEIWVEVLSEQEIKRRIVHGEIRDAKTVAGIMSYLALKK